MTIPDGYFSPYPAHNLGAILYRVQAGVPVEIEIEDPDGNVVGRAGRLYLAELQDQDGKPIGLKVIGRMSRPIRNA